MPSLSASRREPSLSRITPPQSKRSRPAMLIGVLLIAGFALVFTMGALRLDHRPSVLVVNRAVAAGSVVGANDITTARLSASALLHPISASELNKIVGRPAAVALVPGTLLTESQLGNASELQANQSLVGVSVKSGQFPPGLTQGARVRVVDTGINGIGGGVLASEAVVMSIAAPGSNDSTGVTVVGLKVASTTAASIATASAVGHVGIVQESQG